MCEQSGGQLTPDRLNQISLPLLVALWFDPAGGAGLSGRDPFAPTPEEVEIDAAGIAAWRERRKAA